MRTRTKGLEKHGVRFRLPWGQAESSSTLASRFVAEEKNCWSLVKASAVHEETASGCFERLARNT